MRSAADRDSGDTTRTAVFLLVLLLIALHPAVRCTIDSAGGTGRVPPAECQLADRGAIFCLDEVGRSYRAR